MAQQTRSVDFLPPIFQTETNKQFLAATLDQLTQEPKFKKTQGFIGRTVGPGVNPNDKYVIEPNATRANYQLEPGVISLDPENTNVIVDAITYPGINDAVGFQGGDQTRPDRLYESEFYTWDPFIDFDAFVNFSQYFWLPSGPDAVDVSSTGVPASDDFVVTRENGVYTFSGLSGENPVIELVRGGSYTFQVAQNNKETVNYRVQNQGTQGYKIDYQLNPTLTLARGNTYVFNLSINGIYPFWIKTAETLGVGDAYNNGVLRNGSTAGLITFTVPQDAPDTLYYVSENQTNMRGVINVVNGTPGTGPGFWIQSFPGVSGCVPTTPNISSRDVYGVVNNGEDLGTITFNVPTKTAQQFYYDLTQISNVDMVSTLKFDQVNNQPVTDFIVQYGGIDGNTFLNNKTVVFTNTIFDATAGGWLKYDLYNPLAAPTVIPFENRYQIYTIQFVTIDDIEYITLVQTGTVNNLEKFTISYGNVYSNTSWYKNDLGYLIEVPLLTASLDTLYYQDGTDPEIFGRFKLIEYANNTILDISNIVGKKNYTSPNGVVFTNGLKVVFRGETNPTSYQNQQYYVSGVGSSIELLPVDNFITPESYVVDSGDSAIASEPTQLDYLTISRASKDLNAWSRSNRWFHIDVINATAEYNNTVAVLDNNYRAKRPIIQFRPGLRLWNMGTLGKQPIDLIDFTQDDAFSNVEGKTSYTIDGYSLTQGSRVVFAVDTDYNVRNKIYVVNFIVPNDIPTTNAGSFQIGCTYSIVTLGDTDWNAAAGTTGVTYAAGDTFVAATVGSGTGIALFQEPVINLVPADDAEVLADESVLCIAGLTEYGKTYWYDGSTWYEAQQKTGIQQAPFFNVYDIDNVSFGDQTKYPSSNFVGSKLFSYAVGDTTLIDPILKFPLQYLNINNVGDIVFENNLYKDTFVYVTDNISTTLPISSGHANEYTDRTTFAKLIGWQTAATVSQQRQQFKFKYTNNTLKLDVAVASADPTIPAIKLYVGSQFQDPSTYSYIVTNNSTIITLNKTYVVGDIVEVLALSNQTSKVGFYQVPVNLESNPLNGNSDSFTLGTIRTHYESICQNLTTITGKINGPNNSRDLGNIVPYGLIILQQSAPLTLAGYFLRSQTNNIFASLQYNNREYVKYKSKLLEAVTQQNIQFQSAGEILDTAIQDITLGKLETQPFYWSDMLPQGSVYIENTYVVSVISTDTFDTVQVYNYKSANYLGMNVYKNGVLLTRGLDYTVATDGPRITVLTSLSVGDKITIQEYSSTYGSFCPNTPTKLGLYPAWRPEIVEIKGSTGNDTMIRGHDGSLTKAFNDIRDQVLLEFELRIYNNLKLDGNPVPLTEYDVLPGQFRDTGFSYNEINNILAVDFLSYCGWNRLDYKTQQYIANNAFTYNYRSAENKLNNQPLLGAWRGIYRYFYDTQQPELWPWEMLGFTIKPDWWEGRYGTAPYTQDNSVLWDDIAAGYVADPVAPYFKPKFARPASLGPTAEPLRGAPWGAPPYPQLFPVIPTGSEGELLPPLDSVVGLYNPNQWIQSWQVGDGGPVEASWWNSSSYPFAVMHLLAVTRPAKFFALFADRDLYRFDTDYNQYLYNGRYRLDANGVEVYGNGLSKASYINWIVDFNRQSGLDSTKIITDDLKNLDVRLCYRMASFSDKQYIKIYTEKSSPNSTNSTLLIPDESYNLLLYKNQPFDRTSYSSIVIQKIGGKFAVFGYSTTQPYFNSYASLTNGRYQTLPYGDTTIQIPIDFTDNVVQVPYGYLFANETAVADFLLGYGQYLETQGLTFTNIDNGYVLSWQRMAAEFLYWVQQGWSDNALINLNPLAGKLSITRPGAVVDSIKTQTSENMVMDQNKRELPTRNLNIVRLGNDFSVEPLTTQQTLSYIDLRFTSYEHMIVLNNKSVFGDLIYAPITGARQNRLTLVAATTTNWNGTIDTPGFILNRDNIEEWTGLRTYTKGEIVKYKNTYWSASKIIQPSETFNFGDWYQSDYKQIQLGLLPNLANKADQLSNSYNINTANLESDNDLLSYGLIGFRPRQYMAALNLDDVSQVNVYRQFLGSKGTILSAELFSQANLGKEAGDYSIYENWAVQRAVYGANANRSFVELRLDRSLLNPNPSIVQVIDTNQTSDADQAILLQDVWAQSYKLTSPEFLPTTYDVPTDTALPTAGYVNLNDVDITVFDINNTATIAANIDKIEVGTSIWVAKTNEYDWNIYRAQQVPAQIIHVCDNLDNTSRVIFNGTHNLSVGDKLIIKQFDTEVNGIYTVVGVPAIDIVNIVFQFTGKRTVADGTGIGFTLATMRVAQASDIGNLPYTGEILPGARVWVDDAGDGHWAVLQKQDVFDSIAAISPVLLDAQERYGASVAQAQNRYAALVGSPRYGFGAGYERGGVYVYLKNANDQYSPVTPVANVDSVLTLDVNTAVGSGIPAARAFGASADFGAATWAAAGAPGSLGSTGQTNTGYVGVIYRDPALGQGGINPYTIWQLLTPPGTSPTSTTGQGQFGYSVAVSQDERWLYVGAPGLNQVHAYGQVPWENQVFTSRGNGVTTSYNVGNKIQISAGTQIKVSIDGTVQRYGIDYTVSGTVVTFTTAPDVDAFIKIERNSLVNLDAGVYYDVEQTATSGSGVNAKFTIVRRRNEVGQPGASTGSVGVSALGSGYNNGDTITIAAADFGGGTSPANDITLTVTAVTGSGGISSFTIAYTPPALTTVFSMSQYFFTVDNIYSFSILVDNVLQRPNIDYTFNAGTGDLTFVQVPLAGTSIIARAEGYYTYVTTLTVPGLVSGAKFGYSVSTSTDGRQVIVGSPYATESGLIEAGSVHVFDRNVQKFIYGTDTSTVSFTLLGTPVGPISVLVNGVFLTNETDGIVNAPNTFSWDGANTVTVNADLQIGDIVEIETNQFTVVQTITQNTLEGYSNFGQALDLCVYNCSLYVGAPQSSQQTWKGGIVERSVNQARIYGVISATVANPALTVGNTLRVNNIDVEITDGTVATLAADINTNVPNVNATVANGILTLAVKNSAAAPVGDKLQVAPGSVGTAFTTLGFKSFAYTQTIQSPYPIDYAAFGASLNISDTAEELTIGAPNGTLYLETIFDDGNTIFDVGTTVFFSLIVNGGVVYLYDYLPSSSNSITNPGKFVFGQQISNSAVQELDNFGIAVNYTSGILMVGAPGSDVGDSSSSDFGRVFVFSNNQRTPAWTVINAESPTVDVRLLNSVFLYDRITSAKTAFLDYINPLQGKILGAARQNIDFVGAIDPAAYNVGPNNIRGSTWGATRVGQVWWNTSTVRFIDPNQDNIIYAAKRWAQIFPGSTVDIYQWIVSPVPPAAYTGPGTPLNTLSYSINTALGSDGTFTTEYYFWVKDITTVATLANKTLSIATVAQYITDPRSSGIAYLAPINGSTVALYNCGDKIQAQDTILDIEYDRQYTNDNVHVEYELIPQDRADGFLSANLYRKFQDSFVGYDTFGNKVPDPTLGVAERYGVQFRPRQSMFADRFAALKNYLTRANDVLATIPATESRNFNLLNSAQPLPASNDPINYWNMKVANLDILSYQDIYAVSLGYRYLVVSDADNRGLWTIYEVQSNPALLGQRQLTLIRVQLWNTPDYWSYIDWYAVGYNRSTRIVATVENYAMLKTINVPIGSSVKVTANAQGKWEIYLLTDLGWERVGLQGGTIEFSAELWDYAIGRFGFDVEVFDAQYFDQEPVIETRKIIQAINEELFVDDLLIERNKALVLMFNFVLSEFAAPEWLVKTSLIDVDHRIRQLIPYQNYVRDNQEFVTDYIQEVKPYHVQVREFNLTYNGFDDFLGDLTDFDVPAYYDTSLEVPQYISPILLPYAHSAYQPFNTVSDAAKNAVIWSQWPYTQWYNNYLLHFESVTVNHGGTGYTQAPNVIVQSTTPPSVPAELSAVINSLGQVVAVNVIEPGAGYRETPTIVFDGGNGTGAQAYPIMVNGLVRSFRTVIKYDRCEFNSGVLTWSPDGTYENGTLVRYRDVVWRAANSDGSSANVGPDFNLEDWVLVPADQLSGADRTMGYYIPGVNEPGLELPLLVDGIDYPGVQVWGDYFLGSNPLGPGFYCTATSSTNNAITCETTLGLALNAPVKFFGNVFGGVVAGRTYFVKEIIDVQRFTISSYDGGGVFALTTETGNMLARVPQLLDTVIESEFTDVALGTRFTDINIDGGEFLGPYEGHAPEELVNGAEFDTVDIRVYTRPGSDWDMNGHAPQIGTIRYTYEPAVTDTYSFKGTVEVPTEVIVSNQTKGIDVARDIDYVVNWADSSITIINNFNDGDVINISTYEVGGGSQLFKQFYPGNEIVNSAVIVPVDSAQIYQIVAFLDGTPHTVDVSYEPWAASTDWNQLQAYSKLDVVNDSGSYYRALQDVPAGIDITETAYWFEFVPAQFSKVTFNFTVLPTDEISLYVFGVETPVQHSWSTALTENFVVDATIASTKTVTLANSLQGTNAANMIVEVNGKRLQPYEGIEWIGDDSSVSFGLPQRGGYPQFIINAPTDIFVWVDNVLQQQNYGAITSGTYSVTNWDGSNTPGRQVVFVDPPAAGSRILIAVSTQADYDVILSNNTLQISSTLTLGDIISVTTWNDTSQLYPLTLVFNGPVDTGTYIVEPYDSTPFDQGNVTGAAGSFDFYLGVSVPVNDFYLGRLDLQRGAIVASRLWVTLDGFRLFEGVDYTVENDYLILSSGVIGGNQVVTVTEISNSVVPEACEFRIFQDLRGVQATYRMTPATTTYLAQELSSTADIAYVVNAANLGAPNLPEGIFGVCTIDGERIMYRYRDTVNNTISGLIRGTAGTGAARHLVGATVYDISRGNLLSERYQDYLVSDKSMGDGSTTIFYAPNISIDPLDPQDSSSTYLDHSIEVYVGGIRQNPIGNTMFGDPQPSQYRYTIMDVSPVAIEFVVDPTVYPPLTAPAAGSEVAIVQRRGKSWYSTGPNVPVTALTVGNQYFIAEVGTTDFTLIGADRNEIGTFFTATALGTGTGLVTTAADGRALQESTTEAAIFLCVGPINTR